MAGKPMGTSEAKSLLHRQDDLSRIAAGCIAKDRTKTRGTGKPHCLGTYSSPSRSSAHCRRAQRMAGQAELIRR